MQENNQKKQIPLRISAQLFADLSAWAEEEFRSLNGQIEYLLHECVQARKKKKGNKQGGRDSKSWEKLFEKQYMHKIFNGWSKGRKEKFRPFGYIHEVKNNFCIQQKSVFISVIWLCFLANYAIMARNKNERGTRCYR